MADADEFDTPENPLQDAVDAAESEKKTFSLTERLQGIKRRTKTVLVFTDLSLVDRYNESKIASENVAAKISEIEKTLGGVGLTPVERADLESDLNDERKSFVDKVAAIVVARKAMLEESMAFHMQAIPNVAIERAKREAREAYKLADGVIPGESADRLEDKYQALLIQAVTVKITTPDGGEALSPSVEDIENAQKLLDSTQWQRLQTQMQLLLFVDGSARAAVDEAGF